MKAEILPPLTAEVHAEPTLRIWSTRLWLPLFLFWLLLLPLVLLALPLLFIAGLVFGFRLFRTLGALLAGLAGFKRTRVKVGNASARVFIKLD